LAQGSARLAVNQVLDRVETMTILRVASGCGVSPRPQAEASLCR